MTSNHVFLTLAIAIGAVDTVRAEVALPALFGSGMVLQREHDVPIWGTADAGEAVRVYLDGTQVAATEADDAGNWRVDLAPMNAGGPHEVRVVGDNTITLSDVLIGEVWLCGGQSNMEFALRNADTADAPVALASHPNLRIFKVKHTVSAEPASDCEGQWATATPEVSAGFSAVAFHFGVALQAELGVPVGLVQCTWSGTPLEAWLSRPALSNNPALVATVKRHETIEAETPAVVAAYESELATWERDNTARKPSLPLPYRPHRGRNGLFNGMVAPIAPFRFRGTLWYQGESNGWFGHEYHGLLDALLDDWRSAFESPDLHFGIVQLANYKPVSNEPLGDRSWTDIREAQQKVAQADPHAGLIVTIDIGNSDDIHPTDKHTVAQRLTRWAMGSVYDADVSFEGPMFSGMSVAQDVVKLSFDHADGLASSNGAPTLPGFEIAGADRVFYPATATLDGATVHVSADAVPAPVAVRYGWFKDPQCTLINAAGLPASPFRTDDWPLQ